MSAKAGATAAFAAMANGSVSPAQHCYRSGIASHCLLIRFVPERKLLDRKAVRIRQPQNRIAQCVVTLESVRDCHLTSEK
jgi:hypothetical protein